MKLHKKYLNSCESKKFARRKFNCIYIYFGKAKAFLESFGESGFRFLKSFIIFHFYISVRQENAGRKWYQGVIHVCDDFNFDEIL